MIILLFKFVVILYFFFHNFLSLRPVQNLEFVSNKEVGKFEDLRIKIASESDSPAFKPFKVPPSDGFSDRVCHNTDFTIIK